MYWQGAEVSDRTQLLNLVVAEARKVPQPEIHIRGDRQARFEAIGRALFIIQQGGLVKVGFLTEPKSGA
jgi:biopolymer transport protein ExbD